MRTSQEADTGGIVLGTLVLSTLVLPWVIGFGTFSVMQSNGSITNLSLIALDFPFAEYAYSPATGQSAWTGYFIAQYMAVVFIVLGGALVITGSLSARHKVFLGVGGLFSALAPIALLGFSESSSQGASNVSLLSSVTIPAGAVLPVFFGILVMSRSQRQSGLLPYQQLSPPSVSPPLSEPSQLVHYCPVCGKRQLHSGNYCESCGADLRQYLEQPDKL